MKVIESVRMLNITIKLPPDHKCLIQALITSLHTQIYMHGCHTKIKTLDGKYFFIIYQQKYQ